jgi:serine/threonine-protein kinase
MGVPFPDNELERLEALHSCGILDTEPEPTFDEIAKLASLLCAAPVALVSMADAHRHWFKARVGLTIREESRDVSFCTHAIASGQAMVVPDTRDDERFARNPLVRGDPAIRFYAGVPLVLGDGLAVGTLCVLDVVPRELSAPQFHGLGLLARQVTTELELRRKLAAARAQGAEVVDVGPAATLTAPPRTLDAPADAAVIAGRWRVERTLASGGMGVVVAAEDLTTGAPVAIKFLLRREQRDPGALARFVREAQALVRVECEHVVRVLDVGNLPGGQPFIVMERLAGEDLAARLARVGPGRVEEAVDAVLQACVAVATAHARGVVHRDLKPANLFATTRADGSTVIKVLDFGISKVEADDPADPTLTRADTVLGSVCYMSPEQMLSGRDVDGRTDVWSLGVILYELLTGERPFEGETIAEICARASLARHRPVRELRPEVPAALAAVVDRCLQKSRDERYASVGELAAALAASRGRA